MVFDKEENYNIDFICNTRLKSNEKHDEKYIIFVDCYSNNCLKS